MPKKSVYKIIFQNEGKLFEVYARSVAPSPLLGFVEVEGLLFGERSTVVVDPTEEKLQSEFAGVDATHIPMHAIVRIDQVAKRGAAKISPVVGGDKIRPFPTPIPVPDKADS